MPKIENWNEQDAQMATAVLNIANSLPQVSQQMKQYVKTVKNGGGIINDASLQEMLDALSQMINANLHNVSQSRVSIKLMPFTNESNSKFANNLKVRLTESQLHNVIRKCVNEALRNEMNEGWVKDETKPTEEIFQDIINKFDENSIMRHIQYEDSTTPYEFFSDYIRDYYDVTLRQCDEILDKLEEYYDLPYFDYSQKEEYLKNNRG